MKNMSVSRKKKTYRESYATLLFLHSIGEINGSIIEGRLGHRGKPLGTWKVTSSNVATCYCMVLNINSVPNLSVRKRKRSQIVSFFIKKDKVYVPGVGVVRNPECDQFHDSDGMRLWSVKVVTEEEWGLSNEQGK